MNQDEHKIVVRRMAGLIAAASVLIAVYVLRLVFLQLVNSDSFKAQATNTTDYNFTVTAARGDIVDSAGRRIAASTTSYNVVLSKLLMGTKTLTPCCSASWSCWKPTAKMERLAAHRRAGRGGPLQLYCAGRQHQRPEGSRGHEGLAGLTAVRHRR